MSEDENEMATIEVPVQLLRDCDNGNVCNHVQAVGAIFRKALDARKSLYERWRGRTGDFVADNEFVRGPKYGGMRSAIVKRSVAQADDTWPERAQLMAAAPEMAAALVFLSSTEWNWGQRRERIKAVIKLALPPDVAKEQLGE